MLIFNINTHWISINMMMIDCRTHQLLIYSVILCSVLMLFYIIVTGGETRSTTTSVIQTSVNQCPNSSYPGTMLTSRAGVKYRIR